MLITRAIEAFFDLLEGGGFGLATVLHVRRQISSVLIVSRKVKRLALPWQLPLLYQRCHRSKFAQRLRIVSRRLLEVVRPPRHRVSVATPCPYSLRSPVAGQRPLCRIMQKLGRGLFPFSTEKLADSQLGPSTLFLQIRYVWRGCRSCRACSRASGTMSVLADRKFQPFYKIEKKVSFQITV